MDVEPRTHPQLRGGRKARLEVAGTTEEYRAEAIKADREKDIKVGCGTGKEATKERSDQCATGEGATESERTGANEADESGMDAEEGHDSDVGKRLTGASGAGETEAGGGVGL